VLSEVFKINFETIATSNAFESSLHTYQFQILCFKPFVKFASLEAQSETTETRQVAINFHAGF